jgi:hypothetical protein
MESFGDFFAKVVLPSFSFAGFGAIARSGLSTWSEAQSPRGFTTDRADQ